MHRRVDGMVNRMEVDGVNARDRVYSYMHIPYTVNVRMEYAHAQCIHCRLLYQLNLDIVVRQVSTNAIHIADCYFRKQTEIVANTTKTQQGLQSCVI